jgi:hypothetical protein
MAFGNTANFIPRWDSGPVKECCRTLVRRSKHMKKLILAAAAAALMSGTAFAGNIGVTMANTDTFLTVLQKGIEKAAKDANQ